jgi:hypothetical protein
MYPGEDYKFDGESVTEYPVAQLGKKVKTLPNVAVKGNTKPIIVSDPRDPRLRAYQDSLSLYNNSTASTKLYNDIATSSKTDKEYMRRVGFATSGNVPDTEYNRLGRELNRVWKKHLNWKPITISELPNSHYDDGIIRNHFNTYEFKKPVQPVVYKKPVQPIAYRKPEPVSPIIQQPTAQPVVKPIVQPTPMRQYTGSPVYSPGAGSGLPSALIGFLGQQGDTTYIKPEDYERFAVPKYGKEFIESKTKKKNGGWLDRYN